MKKVLIEYNPYTLETKFTVDEKELAQNSRIRERIAPGTRLQEWIEDLPHLLLDEYNDSDFDVTFHGTLLDFEDLTEVFTLAHEKDKLTARLDRIPAKETADKEVLIDDIFKDIQAGPFEELKDAELLNAFQQARSNDFEVCVVATMSAGKSTLINAMLGKKLLPSKQEACTAIITRIKDTEGTDKWRAEVYNKDNELIETQENLTCSIMNRFNDDKSVSLIKVSGDIPFVSAEDASLVLIDTPGPNNTRDPEHKKIQSDFLNKSSKALVLYIMEGTFGSDDDNALLQRVADSMKVGGKQSKDRFIFVVNKMDDRKQEDGDTVQTLERVRAYLKNHDITNPNLFPAAALPALNIRLIKSGADIDEDTRDETDMKVRKLNRNETLHLETNASLPKSIRKKIDNQADDARQHGDADTEALIHTGVVSIEAAIRQYVQKYAKTAKIKNIADTFTHKLDAVGCFEKAKQELAKNRENCEQIAAQIASVRKKVDAAESALEFKAAVDVAVKEEKDGAVKATESIVQKYQKKTREIIDKYRGKELTFEEAEYERECLHEFAVDLEPDFKSDLDELIRAKLLNTSNALLDAYKKKLVSLTEEIDPNTLAGIKIDPLEMMNGCLAPVTDLKELVQNKRVEDGNEWVKNTDKKWFLPWTWFQEKGYLRQKYKDVEYIKADDLAQIYMLPINEWLERNNENARDYASKLSNKIVANFNEEFERLDFVLKEKLSELESYATNKEKADERVEESERRLAWLETIKSRVASTLEI